MMLLFVRVRGIVLVLLFVVAHVDLLLFSVVVNCYVSCCCSVCGLNVCLRFFLKGRGWCCVLTIVFVSCLLRVCSLVVFLCVMLVVAVFVMVLFVVVVVIICLADV